MAVAVVLSVLGTTQAVIVNFTGSPTRWGPTASSRHVARVNARFQTLLRATVFWGCAMVAIADLYVVSSSLASAFDDVVNAEAIAFTVLFTSPPWPPSGATGVLRRSVVDLAVAGVFPLFGATVLAWVLVRSIPELDATARWTVAGVGVLGWP